MVNILALDTTLGACSSAISSNEKLLGSKKEIRARGHVERLLPMMDELFVSSNVSVTDMDYVTVTIGPGTFAGVRIGVSAAKGIALALDIPIIPVSSLEALAFEFASNNVNCSGKMSVAIDARRGETYLQSFEIDRGMFEAVNEPTAVSYSDASQLLPSDALCVIGSGGEFIENLELQCQSGYDHPDAQYIACLGNRLIDRAMAGDDVSPLYLRAPDAVKPAPLELVVSDG